MRIEHEPSAEEIQALIDGELSPEDAARVRSALACGGSALLELDECMQMAALAFVLRERGSRARERGARSRRAACPSAPSNVIPLRRPIKRRPKTFMAMVASLAMAGAAALLMFPRLAGPSSRVVAVADPSQRFAGALAPRRLDGAATVVAGAPIDTGRTTPPAPAARANAPAETLSFELLGRVEKLGDPRAMTAARVLGGDTIQAAQPARPRRSRSPDADSDRAAIALVEGKPEDALLAASAAVESDPRHVQATWNRALALERLGLPLTAAEAFEAVAARREPGWSQEATERATALRAQFERRKSAWEAANAAGARLVAGGMVDDATLAAYPSLMRRYFYEAVRTAASAERVKALRPIAATLDSRFGGSHLTAYVDRIARSDFRRRGPLAARYAVLARREMKDPAAVQALLRDLRAARQKDMLLGALLHASPTDWRPDKAHLDEYLALARASTDPGSSWRRRSIAPGSRSGTSTSRSRRPCSTGLRRAATPARLDELCLDAVPAAHARLSCSFTAPPRRRGRSTGPASIARVSGNVAVSTELLWYAHAGRHVPRTRLRRPVRPVDGVPR